jgi:hypothetical protein
MIPKTRRKGLAPWARIRSNNGSEEAKEKKHVENKFSGNIYIYIWEMCLISHTEVLLLKSRILTQTNESFAERGSAFAENYLLYLSPSQSSIFERFESERYVVKIIIYY